MSSAWSYGTCSAWEGVGASEAMAAGACSGHVSSLFGEEEEEDLEDDFEEKWRIHEVRRWVLGVAGHVHMGWRWGV